MIFKKSQESYRCSIKNASRMSALGKTFFALYSAILGVFS